MTDDERSTRQVLEQNEAFYAAFNARDVDAMAAVWAEESPCACLHPSSPPIHGRASVLRSWFQILSNPDTPIVACMRSEMRRYGNTVVVDCYERASGRRDEQRTIAVLAATNVFVREDGAWRVAHHHASPVSRDREPEPPPPGALN